MADVVTCVYCGKELTGGEEEACLSCKAKFLHFQKFIVKSQPQTAPAGDQVEDLPGDAAEEAIFPVPRKGEMLQGLYDICAQIQTGALTKTETSALLTDISTNINQVFDNLHNEIQNIPVDAPEYAEELIMLLEEIRYLLNHGLAEVSLYLEDENAIHLRMGLMLSEVGEDKFIALIKRLNKEATGNPFEGMENVPEMLAAEFAAGRITKEKFDEEFEELNKIILGLNSKAQVNLGKAFELAKKYDSTNDKVMMKSLEQFKYAQEHLSKMIIHLYSSQDLESAAERILNNVEQEVEPEPQG